MKPRKTLQELGRRVYSRGYARAGKLTVTRWRRFLVELAELIGMEPVADAATWQFPIAGKGGYGYTIVQPITESFLALDTWPDHDGAYLFIVSCRPFYSADIDSVAQLLNLESGHAVHN